ncbi:MAG: response regulator [Ilyomonas sp.]
MPRFNRVLLIEDDPITLLVCERIIKLTDFADEVISTKNGQEGLDYINDSVNNSIPLPEIIFLDINMPVINGWEFLDSFGEMINKLPALPRIYILSSTVDPEDERKGISYPYVNQFVSKPLTKEFLLSIS